MRALKSAIAYSGQAQIGTWLAAIVLNVLRDQYRAASRTESGDTVTMLAGVPAEDAGAVLGMMKDEMGACITGHLLALPERQRRVLVLHDMAGASHTEVAEALGISEGNAGIVLYRARAALRERLSMSMPSRFRPRRDPLLTQRTPPFPLPAGTAFLLCAGLASISAVQFAVFGKSFLSPKKAISATRGHVRFWISVITSCSDIMPLHYTLACQALMIKPSYAPALTACAQTPSQPNTPRRSCISAPCRRPPDRPSICGRR